MAILNEWAIMGPNYLMLGISIVALITSALVFYLIVTHENLNALLIFVSVVMIPVLFVVGLAGIVLYDEPEFEIPTGKKYIEATFANGAPTAAILQKYDVIDTDGKAYLLREKDGVKDEKRPKVRIGEEEVR